MSFKYCVPVPATEEAKPEDPEELETCEADSLDSAIDPEDHRATVLDEDEGDYIDSIVCKGKKIRRGGGLHSHHFSSVGNLLQVRNFIPSSFKLKD